MVRVDVFRSRLGYPNQAFHAILSFKANAVEQTTSFDQVWWSIVRCGTGSQAQTLPK